VPGRDADRSLAGRLGGSAGELSGVSHDLLAQSQEMTTQAESVLRDGADLVQHLGMPPRRSR